MKTYGYNREYDMCSERRAALIRKGKRTRMVHDAADQLRRRRTLEDLNLAKELHLTVDDITDETEPTLSELLTYEKELGIGR